MIVLDASAAIEWLLRTPAGQRVEHRLFARKTALHAPHLIDLEVAQALRRLVAAHAIDAARGAEVLADLADTPLRRHPHDLFIDRIWEMRGNMTAYDAAYVALAEALDAPVVTCDRKVAAFRGHQARIELV